MSKEKLLLHSCCGPCSLYMLQKLQQIFKVEVFFYNPNIFPHEEYLKRKKELEAYCQRNKIVFYEEDWNLPDFDNCVQGYEKEPERGVRCDLCYNLRMEETAQKAKDLGIKIFATTLIMGRQKKTDKILEIGQTLAKKYHLKYHDIDYKKQGGSQINDRLSRRENFYRQKYCGCKYSLPEN